MKNEKSFKLSLAVIFTLSLGFTGCGGGSSDSSTTTNTQTGIFVDAPVQGLHYITATQDGYTNDKGEFKYVSGETVEFKLGNLSLGSVPVGALITPYTIGDSNTINPSNKTTNIAMLLQSFDGNRSNRDILDLSKLKEHDFSNMSLDVTTDVMTTKIASLFADNSFSDLRDSSNNTPVDATNANYTMKSFLTNLTRTTKVEFPDYTAYSCKKQEISDSAVFCIKSDDTYESIGLNPSESEITLLKKILHDFPRRMRERIVEIRFKAEDIGEGSAGVSPLDDNKVHWDLWVNTSNGVFDEEDPLESTIAHELEHYLTLNYTQMSSADATCGDIRGTLEVCPTKSSIYNGFIQEFWVDIYDKSIWPDGDYNTYYDEHNNDFVTPYAVTNPGEDIAETFSEFIYKSEPIDLTNTKDKKIKYFWNFSELIKLRSEIRSNIGL